MPSLRSILISSTLSSLFTFVKPFPLEERGDSVCSSGIYGELVPILGQYEIAQVFCTAIYPVKCTSVAKRSLDERSAIPMTTPSATTTSRTSSSTTTKTTTPTTTARTTSSTTTKWTSTSTTSQSRTTAASTSTRSTTSSANAKSSAWAKCQQQPWTVISTICSCIETPKPCKTSTTSTRSTTTTTSKTSSSGSTATSSTTSKSSSTTSSASSTTSSAVTTTSSSSISTSASTTTSSSTTSPSATSSSTTTTASTTTASTTTASTTTASTTTASTTTASTTTSNTCAYTPESTDTAGSTTQYGTGAQFMISYSSFYSSYDSSDLVSRVYTSSLQGCINACAMNTQCAYFNFYSPSTSYCDLLAAKDGGYCESYSDQFTAGAETQAGTGQCASYPYAEMYATTGSNDLYYVYDGTDYSTYSQSDLIAGPDSTISTLQGCIDSCDNNANCFYFNFYKGSAPNNVPYCELFDEGNGGYCQSSSQDFASGSYQG